MASSNSTVVSPLDLIPRIHVDDTFGAFLLATCIGLSLFGLNVHQAYRYFRLYPTDAALFKWVVILTMILEMLNTVLQTHTCYYYLVTNFYNPIALETGVWSVKLLALCMGFTMFVTQIFFARRVYLIGSNYRIISVIASALLVGELAFAAAYSVETYIQVTFAKFYEVAPWVSPGVYAMGSVADAMLAASLVFLVRRTRRNVKRVEHRIDVAIVYLVNTGLLTSMLSILSLAFTIRYTRNLIYAGFNIVATRLYSNSLLAVLNSRRSEKDHGAEGFETGSLGLAVIRDRQNQAVAEQWNVPQLPELPNVIDIKVTTEMVNDIGNDDGTGDGTSTRDEEMGTKQSGRLTPS
ncbi:hypothetical protein LXA43DRAFT_168850 [Ganoderma leucocontextum]|nr:hypothetical protein LXA43DRAFT_168850 [Ganoderma leucocontextum]